MLNRLRHPGAPTHPLHFKFVFYKQEPNTAHGEKKDLLWFWNTSLFPGLLGSHLQWFSVPDLEEEVFHALEPGIF